MQALLGGEINSFFEFLHVHLEVRGTTLRVQRYFISFVTRIADLFSKVDERNQPYVAIIMRVASN